MFSFGALILIAQVFCVVHVIRQGRNTIWIMVIIFLPAVGCLAYLVAEILPDLMNSRTARQATGSATRLVDRLGALKRAENDFALADTVDNRRNYAAELMRHGRAAEAAELLEQAATGMHQDDPGLLHDLASANFELGRFDATLALLDRLQQANPNLTSPEAHLLYARALEGAGRDDEAATEYQALIGYFPGEEARCRYAELLARQGKVVEAKAIYGEIVQRQKHAPRYYRQSQRAWIDIARSRV
jgi:hypothetical protein